MSTRASARHVDPATIDRQIDVLPGVELFFRRRPPGGVDLPEGHREHVLLCTTGVPLPGTTVRSRLRTPLEERLWNDCPARHISLLPAGFPVSWDWSYASRSVHLVLSTEFLDALAGQIGGNGPARPAASFRRFRPHLAGLLTELVAEATQARRERDLAVTSLTTLIALDLLRGEAPERDPAEGDADFRRRCLDLLRQRLAEPLPLETLAAEFDLSPAHFARRFKAAVGLPPHACRLQLRIERAQELLAAAPRRPLADIACELGFADESHFRRHFKRLVGTTPGRWRDG